MPTFTEALARLRAADSANQELGPNATPTAPTTRAVEQEYAHALRDLTYLIPCPSCGSTEQCRGRSSEIVLWGVPFNLKVHLIRQKLINNEAKKIDKLKVFR